MDCSIPQCSSILSLSSQVTQNKDRRRDKESRLTNRRHCPALHPAPSVLLRGSSQVSTPLARPQQSPCPTSSHAFWPPLPCRSDLQQQPDSQPKPTHTTPPALKILMASQYIWQKSLNPPQPGKYFTPDFCLPHTPVPFGRNHLHPRHLALPATILLSRGRPSLTPPTAAAELSPAWPAVPRLHYLPHYMLH